MSQKYKLVIMKAESISSSDPEWVVSEDISPVAIGVVGFLVNEVLHKAKQDVQGWDAETKRILNGG